MDKPFLPELKVEPLFTKDHLFEHKAIVLRWIRSCETFEQLKLMASFIETFFIPGYEKSIEETKSDADKGAFRFDLELYKVEFKEAIEERKTIVAAKKKSPRIRKT